MAAAESAQWKYGFSLVWHAYPQGITRIIELKYQTYLAKGKPFYYVFYAGNGTTHLIDFKREEVVVVTEEHGAQFKQLKRTGTQAQVKAL